MKRLFILVLALLLCLPLSVLSAGADVAEAYTSALEDLSSCEGFSQAKYPPINSKAYATFEVLHVAESEDNQLFVYVYQPSAESIPLIATKISLGNTKDGLPGSYKLYDLVLLNQQGVFQKYLVKDFLVSDADDRYYDIPAIYRPFNAALDAAPTDDNTIDYIATEVGYMWTYSGAGDAYAVERQEVITVTVQHAGFIRYDEDYIFAAKGKDCHYVAFNTDKEIDELISADLHYSVWEVDITTEIVGGYKNTTTDEKLYQECDPTIIHEEIFVNTGLFSSTGYDRIDTASHFVSSENLIEESNDKLKDCKWVLRFLETDYRVSKVPMQGSYIEHEVHYRVNEVTILRLSFLDDGIQYNMGVVSNIISGDEVPDNEKESVPDWFITLLIVVAILVLLVLLWLLSIAAPVLKPVLSALVWILLLPFKLLWWLICKLWDLIRKE